MRDEDLQLPSPTGRARRAGRSHRRFGAGRHVAMEVHGVPIPEGHTGSVDGGVGYVSDSSQKFGDYTGLDNKGAYAILGGSVSRRGDDGYWADLRGERPRPRQPPAGRPGRPRGPLYAAHRLCRDPAPPDRRRRDAVPRQRRQRADAARRLSGRRHRSMPLGSTLQPIDIGYKYRRLDLGGTVIGGQELELWPELPARRARRHQAGLGLVLLHRVAVRRAGEGEDRPASSSGWRMRQSSCRRR